MGGPLRATPQVGETIRDGKIHLTVTEISAEAIRVVDAKGKARTIRLDPGVRFDWDADRDVWTPHD